MVHNDGTAVEAQNWSSRYYQEKPNTRMITMTSWVNAAVVVVVVVVRDVWCGEDSVDDQEDATAAHQHT